ncbi:MAG: hypothetical protein J6V37_05320, partial [Clostridia bacterium]|nr:hypothetical protein [Clostridia bacterium]
ENNKAWLSKVAEDLNELQSNKQTLQDSAWMSATLDQIVTLLERLTKMTVSIDGNALVGVLTPALDGRLSDRWSHAMRGNTR